VVFGIEGLFIHGNAADISSRVDILRNIIHPKI
jgi:hypothetical protein